MTPTLSDHDRAENILVRRPDGDFSRWREYGWRAEPDATGIAAEHEAFCEALAAGGAEVVFAASEADGNPDAIYVYDPAIVGDSGAILLRPGKKGRRAEVAKVLSILSASECACGGARVERCARMGVQPF